MKPTFQEHKSTGSVGVDMSSSDVKTKQSSNTLVKRFVIAVVSVTLLCGVIFAAVYLGKRLTSNNFKEYHGIIHREGGKTTEETCRLTNTEEEFENEDVRVIYDFDTGLAAFSLKDQNENGLTDCYVISFNMTETKTPDDVRNELKSTEFEITATIANWNKYEVTEVWLNEAALGERSKSVCSGRDIYFFRIATEEPSRIAKRGICIRLCFFFFCITIGC